VKRMALALHGLIRREFPGDYLQFAEMYTFARPRHAGEIAGLLPRPVTIYDPVVRLYVDMSDERITEADVPPHFTNIQHGPPGFGSSDCRCPGHLLYSPASLTKPLSASGLFDECIGLP